MTSICLYFKVHQAYRLGAHELTETSLVPGLATIGKPAIDQLAEKCYLPTNQVLLELLTENKFPFRVSFSISGTVIEQLQRWRPDVIDSFRALVSTGAVELLAETYYHSLASLHSQKEWRRQIELHTQLLIDVFGVKPLVYRNTELIHNNQIAAAAAE